MEYSVLHFAENGNMCFAVAPLLLLTPISNRVRQLEEKTGEIYRLQDKIVDMERETWNWKTAVRDFEKAFRFSMRERK
jgi:hypothetical protein